MPPLKPLALTRTATACEYCEGSTDLHRCKCCHSLICSRCDGGEETRPLCPECAHDVDIAIASVGEVSAS